VVECLQRAVARVAGLRCFAAITISATLSQAAQLRRGLYFYALMESQK